MMRNVLIQHGRAFPGYFRGVVSLPNCTPPLQDVVSDREKTIVLVETAGSYWHDLVAKTKHKYDFDGFVF